MIIGLHHIKVNLKHVKLSSHYLGDLWEVFLVTWFRLATWDWSFPKQDPDKAIAEAKHRSAWTASVRT